MICSQRDSGSAGRPVRHNRKGRKCFHGIFLESLLRRVNGDKGSVLQGYNWKQHAGQRFQHTYQKKFCLLRTKMFDKGHAYFYSFLLRLLRTRWKI